MKRLAANRARRRRSPAERSFATTMSTAVTGAVKERRSACLSEHDRKLLQFCVDSCYESGPGNGLGTFPLDQAKQDKACDNRSVTELAAVLASAAASCSAVH